MASNNEQDFPRGGIKRVHNASKSTENPLFPREHQNVRPQNKKRKSETNPIPREFQFLDTVDLLTYEKIQEGMLILGCIRSIMPFSLEMTLPGRCFAKVKVNAISDHYSEELHKKLCSENSNEMDDLQQLNKILSVGQYVPTKVLTRVKTDSGWKVNLTMKPSEINSNFNRKVLAVGMWMWGAVSSRGEHGYEIDFSVDNCKTFLPDNLIEKDRTYLPGQPIWCVITKLETFNNESIIKVSTLPSSKENAIDIIPQNLDILLPGIPVHFRVESTLKNGLQGMFLDYLGGVNECYLSEPLDNYEIGKTYTSRVLYVEPISKLTHLMLRNLDLESPPKYENGRVLNAQIVSRVSKGFYIKVNKDGVGYVPHKRLNDSHKNNLMDVIKRKYPKGSTHQCRILDYNRFDKMYMCTFESSLIKEAIFSKKDLKLGQTVTCEVKEISYAGLIVTMGQLDGFITSLHCTNGRYSDTLRNKFTVGQKLTAKVWNIRENNSVHLTLKQAFLDCDLCLHNSKDAELHKQYPGLVGDILSNGLLIIFYGDFKIFLHKQNIDLPNNEPIEDGFFKGEVIMPTVTKKSQNDVIFSLKSSFKNNSFRVGQLVNAVVTGTDETGLIVEAGSEKIKSLVPVVHLSSSLSLVSTLLNVYKVGHEFENLLCIDNKAMPVLSVREAMAYIKSNLEIKKWNLINRNSMIRCLFKSKCEDGIFVTPLIRSFNQQVKIGNEDLCDNQLEIQHLKFKPGQAIVAKVFELNPKTRGLTRLTAKFSQVFDYTIESGLDKLETYLITVKKIHDHFREMNHALAQFHVGQKVTCVTNKVDPAQGCSVLLKDGVQGIVESKHCPAGIQPGTNLQGVILWIDFTTQCVEISLMPEACDRINPVQNGLVNKPLNSSAFAHILLVRTDFALAVIKGEDGNNQLIFLPTFLHENDFIPNLQHYRIAPKIIKVRICQKVDSFLIGYHKVHLKELQKLKPTITLSQKLIPKIKAVKKVIKTTELRKPNAEQKLQIGTIEETQKSVEQPHIEKTQKTKKQKCILKATTPTADDLETEVILPGIEGFYEDKDLHSEQSSDDEEMDEAEEINKKKKLTSAERRGIIAEEEERILAVEKELADSTAIPKSVDQFERALLSSPNLSELWSKYVSFHLSFGETEKARTVVQRALNTIDMRELQEKYNIWIVSLNLENMYGTTESFQNAFQEAVRCNDSLPIYVEVIEMLAAAGKFDEMSEKITKVRSKFKQEPKMWVKVGEILYKYGRTQDGSNFKDAALKTLTDQQTHVNLIVQFALFEFKYGAPHQGEVLFETIIQSHPQRVDVWSTYVDQLVKTGNIELARSVLERGVCQKLSLKKMKTLFEKFKNFEKKYGNENQIESVNKVMRDFVARAI